MHLRLCSNGADVLFIPCSSLRLCFCYPRGILSPAHLLGSIQTRLGHTRQEVVSLRCRKQLHIVSAGTSSRAPIPFMTRAANGCSRWLQTVTRGATGWRVSHRLPSAVSTGISPSARRPVQVEPIGTPTAELGRRWPSATLAVPLHSPLLV